MPVGKALKDGICLEKDLIGDRLKYPPQRCPGVVQRKVGGDSQVF